jgi:hypothetical protein
MLDDMQRRGFIEKSDSPWSSVVGRRSDQEKEQGTPLLRVLQEIKRCHKGRLFSTVPD